MNVHTNSTAYAYKDTKVTGYILDVEGQGKTAYLQVGNDDGRITFILMGKDSTDFLDKLSNEAERLTREFIGDVPPLEPLSDDCPNCKADDCVCVR